MSISSYALHCQIAEDYESVTINCQSHDRVYSKDVCRWLKLVYGMTKGKIEKG